MDWLTSFAPSVHPTLLKGYTSILHAYHTHNSLHSGVFEDPQIDLIIKGAQRLYGEGEHRLRLPLIEDTLLKLLFITYDFNGINIWAAICLGFAAFLHSSEFTWDSWDPSISPRLYLARQHFKFMDSSLSITRPSSKTAVATNVDIYLIPSTSLLCPVSAICRLISQCPTPPNSSAFSHSLGGSFIKPYFPL